MHTAHLLQVILVLKNSATLLSQTLIMTMNGWCGRALPALPIVLLLKCKQTCFVRWTGWSGHSDQVFIVTQWINGALWLVSPCQYATSKANPPPTAATCRNMYHSISNILSSQNIAWSVKKNVALYWQAVGCEQTVETSRPKHLRQLVLQGCVHSSVKPKQNKTKQNKTKQNKIKTSKTKQTETRGM